MQKYYNPFAGIDLRAPIDQRDFYEKYCQRVRGSMVDQSPFPRMIDFWFAGLSLAARKQLAPTDLSGQKTFKFNEGSVLDSDNSWRVQAVMLIAIAVKDDVKIVSQPRPMIAIANGLAAAGIPSVVELLQKGNQDAIWNISEALYEMLNQTVPRTH